MARDLGKWLVALGLERYIDTFQDNDIGWETLAELNHELLKEAGVHAEPHR